MSVYIAKEPACLKASALNRARKQADSFGAVTIALRPAARERTQRLMYFQNPRHFSGFLTARQQALAPSQSRLRSGMDRV